MIPTYNEAENVDAIVAGIRETGLDLDLLFVDDNSPDGTGAILDRLAAEYPRLRVLHRPGKQGIGSAHKAGIRWAYDHGYARLVTMDSDLSHSPSAIARLLEADQDSDVVVGSRFMNPDSLEGWAWDRKLLTHLGHIFTTLSLNLPQDCTNAFRRYRLDRIPHGIFEMVESTGYSFFYESLHRLNVNGLKISQIAIDLPARTYGHSKMRVKDIVHSFRFLVQLGWRTRVNRASLVYAQPFAGIDSGDQAQVAWDEYWSGAIYQHQWVYDLVASFYRRVIIRPAVNHFIGRAFTPSARLLHAGCGTGAVDVDVFDRFDITALDISPKALTEYARHHGRRGTLLQGSLFAIPADPATFDGVFNLGVMEHFTEDEIKRILDEFHRVLKPGGRIVLFWPPAYGPSVQALKWVHIVIRRVLRKHVVLHPPELTHVVSRRQIERYLAATGFRLEVFYFGLRDMFTHRIIAAERCDVPATMAVSMDAPDGIGLARAGRTV